MSAIRLVPVFKSASAATAPAIRSISSTARLQKGPVEAAKETVKQADRAVSGAAVKGLDKGGMSHATSKVMLWEHLADELWFDTEEARNKVKDAVQTSSGEAQSKVEGEAENAAGEVKGKTQEAMGEIKGKAKEAKQNTVG